VSNTLYALGPSVSVLGCGGSTVVRIVENAMKSVVFFGVPSVQEGKEFEYRGTGFLMGRREEGVIFGYLVTAKHVAEGLDKWRDTGFVLRANLKSGGSFPFQLSVWSGPLMTMKA
jgi:S1-C subfamily serine protease